MLFKSLFKSIITGKAYKKETRAVVRRMRFIKNKVKWWLDFSFLLNFSMTYSMNNLWYPLVLASLYTEKSHAHLIEKLFETLKTYYYLKITIKAMRISMTGTFDRHGRTQHKIFQLGEFELSNDKTFVVYDSLQVATTYGMTTVKF